MRAAAVIASSVWIIAVALDVACVQSPRVEWCRTPMTDFSGITDVRVRAMADPNVSVIVTATGTGLGDCVEVTSTMNVPARGSDTTRVFVRADLLPGTLTTRPVYHYDGPIGTPFGGSVVVVALGRTIEAPIEIAGVPLDASSD